MPYLLPLPFHTISYYSWGSQGKKAEMVCHSLLQGAMFYQVKKGWIAKNWCLWTMVLKKLLRVPWIARRLNQSILKEINTEYLLEGLMLRLKLQYLATWCKEPAHWKDPDAGKQWRQEEKGMTELVGQHLWLNGHEFQWTPGDGEAQGAWHDAVYGGSKELEDWLNNNK